MGEGSAAPRHFHPSHLAAYCCGISQEEINGHNNEESAEQLWRQTEKSQRFVEHGKIRRNNERG